MLLQQLVNGLMLGSSYSLLAIGYTLVFGVLKVLHMAHGEVFMIGAYIALQVILLLRVNIFVAIVASMVGTAFLGIIIELVAIRSLRWKGHHLSPLITTIALSIILQELVVKFFGGEQVRFPEAMEVVNFHLGGVTVSSIQILIITMAASLMVLLSLFIKKSRWGVGMRAAAEDPRVASLMGVSVNRIVILTFAVASALAGAAGVMVGLSYNAVSPFIGMNMGLKGIVVMLLGGLGNIYGAMLGGLILGSLEVLSVAYLSSSYRDAIAFAVMILILLFRPQGLLGARLRE